MTHNHIFDPKHAAFLESETRKAWQDPKEILELLTITTQMVAADLGCGNGFFTVPLSCKTKKVYGIDVQKEMLELLEQKLCKLKIENIELRLSGEKTIPLDDKHVDLLITVNTLHEFPDRTKTIKEIQRVLKPNGHVLIVDFKKEETPHGPPVQIRVSQLQAKQLFEEQGFSLIKSHELLYHYVLVFRRD